MHNKIYNVHDKIYIIIYKIPGIIIGVRDMKIKMSQSKYLS